MTKREQYQLEKMPRSQTETTSEHIYDKIVTECHQNTLNETKDAPALRISTDVTTSIRLLKVVCLVLVILVIIMVTANGILLSELKKIDNATKDKIDFQDLLAAFEESNNTISQLESDRTKDLAIIQQHATKIAQFESARTKDLARIQQHSTEIAQLESDRADYLATIQGHNTRLMDLEEDQAGQPSYAFSAYNVTGAHPYNTIVFAITLLDEDGVYSNSTGMFTTPTSGIYVFSTTLCASGSHLIAADFVVDGTVVNFITVGTVHFWGTCSSGSATARLQKGAQVFMKVRNIPKGSGIIDDTYRRNSFSGHLLSV